MEKKTLVYSQLFHIICLCLLQSEIGFGKLETYIKLDKLGEVR